MLLFRTASEAQGRLGSAERCEVCGAWSANRSKAPKGAIVGPRLDGSGAVIVSRLCCECDGMGDAQLKRHLAGDST